MIRYTITRHPSLAGVGLSKAGHWGGVRFATDAEAEAFAIADAGRRPYNVQRETSRAKLKEVRP